jgi:IS5 family transposase
LCIYLIVKAKSAFKKKNNKYSCHNKAETHQHSRHIEDIILKQ